MHYTTICLLVAGALSSGPVRDQSRLSFSLAEPPGASEVVTLSDTTFPPLLEGLGFRPQQLKTPQGFFFWRVKVGYNGSHLHVDFLPTRSQGQIVSYWLISDLGDKLDHPGALSAPALLKLLEKNHQIAPYFFSCNAATGHVAMNFEHPSNKVSKALLKKELDGFITMIRTTAALWDTKALQGGTAAPGVSATLAGTRWTGTETLKGYGILTFEFHPNGQATMIDTEGVSLGQWFQKGSEVTILFYSGKVIYQGTVSGDSIAGSARNVAGTSWHFHVSLASGTASSLAPPKR